MAWLGFLPDLARFCLTSFCKPANPIMEQLRPRAEVLAAEELSALKKQDQHPRPEGWQLSPRAVCTFILGGTLADGTVIRPKFFGSTSRIEVAVATLATERALLLTGPPGTAKSRVAEHLAAAISGESSLIVQGTAGTTEEALRYGWNYAELLTKGPSEKAILPSPILRGMRDGKVARIEELTRMVPDVQDALITLLSEKVVYVPELEKSYFAARGFNLIATANSKDRGVNPPSAALMRRFNVVQMPLPEHEEDEVRIVEDGISRFLATHPLPEALPSLEEIQKVVQLFRELRSGQTQDGRRRFTPSRHVLSPADHIAIWQEALTRAAYLGQGNVQAEELGNALENLLVQDPEKDFSAWQEYLQGVLRQRKGWEDLYAYFSR